MHSTEKEAKGKSYCLIFMPRVEFDQSRRRFLGGALATVGLLTTGVSVVDMITPLDDPQKRDVSILTTQKEDFSKILEVRDVCRKAIVNPSSAECLKAEQDVGRELEAQMAFRGKLRQEQHDRDNVLLLVGIAAGLIGLKISR